MTEAKEVTGASTNWIQTFGYDTYGNRTSFSQTIGGIQTNSTPLINPNTNRFTSTSFTYDKNGNIARDTDPTTAQSRQFVFNGDNKQIEVKDANGTPIGKYYYDGEGKRVKKVTATETTIFVYSAGKLVAEYSTQISSAPTLAYTTTDHLGSPRIITDKSGNVKSRRDFMPFGEDIFVGVGGRTSDSGQRYSSNADDIRQKFTGYQKDAETNFDFAEARMYENRYGRFTAVDPLIASGKSVNPQTFNRYIYVGNNPLAFVDPTGLIWGTAADGRVRWFDKKLGKGFTEFKPDNWQYIGNDKKLYELDSNSSKWHEIKPVQVFAEDNPIQTLATSVSDTFDESLIGAAKGGGNFAINTWNFATQPGSSSGAGLGIPNPFEVAPYTYDNATQWKFGTATETGLTVAPLFAAAQFSPSGVPSVVPQTARVGQFEVGTFSVIDWTGYPKGYSRPSGIFRLLQGEEYTNARILASKTNRTLRSENPGMFEGAHIHEIKPVKFGGSPTNPANKISIPRSVHEQQFTPWWNRLQRDLQQ